MIGLGAGVGDAACDTVIVWTHLRGGVRRVYRRELAADDGTRARGRGRGIWKSLILLGNRPVEQGALGRHVLDTLLAER